jgi:hypothetical protein
MRDLRVYWELVLPAATSQTLKNPRLRNYNAFVKFIAQPEEKY